MFGFIKRCGGAITLTNCERKFGRKLNVELVTKTYNPRVVKAWSKRHEEKVVWVKDLVWVDQWATFYGLHVPHHSSRVPLS
jgi:hypothetical protein